MSTEIIKKFNFEKCAVRVILINCEPWWVLKDVCDVLGLSNPTVVASRLDDDEKSKIDPKPNLGSKSNEPVLIINEYGLYNVILRSDKPEAKAFSKWVTHEVIPSIRKKGYYGQMSKGVLMDLCKKHKVTPDEYYQYATGSPYKFLPLQAKKEKSYQRKIVKLENELYSYREINGVYEYTIREVAAKSNLTEYDAWQAIHRFEKQGWKFEYKEILNKTRFTQTDKMLLYMLINRERNGIDTNKININIAPLAKLINT